MNKAIRAYIFPFVLLFSILFGALAGFLLGAKVEHLKFLGDIFINLLFTVITPLIFFSLSSAVGRVQSLKKLSTIFMTMLLVFLFTSFIAALYSLIIVKMVPITVNHVLSNFPASPLSPKPTVSEPLVSLFTVTDFFQLFSHENILALVIFAILFGLAVNLSGEKNRVLPFLEAGEKIFMKIFTLIMFYAPLGFFAYFAVLVYKLGPELMNTYFRIVMIYSLAALIYFIFGFSFYAYLANGYAGVKLFWKNVFLPAVTSLATCSSAASIPANLAATRAMQVSAEIGETVIPIGTLIHKDGSVIGGLFKIAFLFSLYQLDFSGFSVLMTALCVAVLVGTVMGAIPSGGMLGEILILNIYGFPPSALMAIATISILIDPLATLLNVTGNTVSSLLIARFYPAE